MFPVFPLLSHTATVTGCMVQMLWWLRTRQERLSHLAHRFREGAGSSRASAQNVQQSPSPRSCRGSAAAHPARQPNITASTRERARRTGVEDGGQTGLATPTQALAFSAVSSRRREGVWGKKKCISKSLNSLHLGFHMSSWKTSPQTAYKGLKSHQTS